MAETQSPVLSDKTVVVQASTPPPEPMIDPKVKHGQALFSTDLGLRPPRVLTGPPKTWPPVIVRSNMLHDVVQSAQYWREKYPHTYHCYFPDLGYDIHDLFDNVDIHIYTPEFCQQLLYFITMDNATRAHHYAVEWAQQNPERVHIVATDIYDEKDPLSLVDKIFINGEVNEYGRTFLWHVANIMRHGMLAHLKKQQLKSSAANVGAAAKASGNEAGKSDLKTKPAVEQKSSIAVEDKQPKPKPAAQSFRQPPFGQSVTAQPFVPPITVYGPRMGFQNQAPVLPMGGPGNMQSPHMDQPPPRRPRGRSGRQSSSSYGHPMPHPSWAENIPLPLTGGQQSRSAIQSPRFQPQAPLLPSSTNIMSPMIPSVYLSHSAVMSPPQPMPYGFQPGIATLSHNHTFAGPGVRGMPIGDITNNTQHPFNSDAHMNRRSSRAEKPPELYNPYGNEKPDFADIPAQGRRGPRNSFSNPLVRSRKYSSAYNRTNGTYAPDRGDSSTMPSGGYQPDFAYAASAPYSISDPTRGCGDTWVGSKNDFVNMLVVFEVPQYASPEKIQNFFEQQTGIKLQRVRAQQDRVGKPIAYLHLYTPADAVKILENKQYRLDDKEMLVKVPKHFYAQQESGGYNRHDPHMGSRPGLESGRGPFVHASQGSRRMSYTQQTGKSSPTYSESKPTYSPQDARSDLNPHLELDNTTTSRGSPEARKTKKQSKSPKKGSEVNPKQSLEDNNALNSSPVAASEKVEQGPSERLEEAPVMNGDRVAKVEPELQQIATPSTTSPPTKTKAALLEHVSEAISGPEKVSQNQMEATKPMEAEFIAAKVTQLSLTPEETFEQNAEQKQPDELKTDTERNEMPSDDEQKNDVSFHSAKESQSDTGKTGLKENTSVHEVQPPQPSQLSGSMIAENSKSGHPDNVAKPGTTEIEGLVKENAVTSQDTLKESIIPLATLSTSTEKKQGPSQTESFSIFAKPKKGKPGKKKDKKKEKTKAVPLKSAEATGVKAKGGLPSDVNASFSDPETRSVASDKLIQEVKSASVESDSKKNKSGGDQREPDSGTGDKGKVNEGECGRSRDFLSPRIFSGVTHEVSLGSSDETPKQRVQESAGASGASSYEKKTSHSTTGLTNGLTSVSMQAEQSVKVKEKQAQTKMTKGIEVAIPNLGLLGKSSSSSKAASSGSSPIETLVPSIEEKNGKEPVTGKIPSKQTSLIIEDGKSAGRGDLALTANGQALGVVSPGLVSPSPTGEEFTTPLQTPSGLAHFETEPKKKPKKNKKAIKAPTTTENSASQQGDSEIPFQAQVEQIDDLKRTSKQSSSQGGMSYYQSRDNMMAGEDQNAPWEAKGVEGADKKNQGSICQEILDYLKEKEAAYALIPEEVLKEQELSREPKQITFEDVEKICDDTEGDQATILRFSNDDGKVPAAGSTAFFDEDGK